MLDFNTEPYNDDFDENDKFYRILFRPSYAVQARELTQMQTILQNQIKRHGDHVFQQGAMVIPGQISLDTKYNYVKLQVFNTAGDVTETFVSNLQGKTVIGESGVTAQVLSVVGADGTDPTTIYVRYTSSGTDTTTKTFSDGEVLTTSDEEYTVTAASSAATGVGSAATIQRGVYYVNGYFVLCDEQSIVLDKYTNTPSYRVGLSVNEVKVTPETSGYERLLDNAQNSYNFAAPGAHRYFIDLILSKVAPDSADDVNFIELLSTFEGQVKREVTKTAYAEIEKTLARRTFDESGNYTIRPFAIDVREHRDNNRGAWAENKAYLIGDVVTNGGYTYVAKNSATSVNIPPTHTSGTSYDGASSTGINWEYDENPLYNRGIYSPEDGGSEAKLAIGLEPGKAYVQGYEIEKPATEYVTVDKAREFTQTTDTYLTTPVGNFVYVTNINSLPPFDLTSGMPTISIYNRFTSSVGVLPAGGTVIGTARVRSIEWDSGTIGAQNAIYKLYLFDVRLNTGYDFDRDAKSFYYSRSDTNLNFTADVNAITTQLAGSATTYTSYPGTRGASTTIYGIGTAFSGGTNTSPALKVGDFIFLNTTTGDVRRRVTAITNNQQITVDSSVTVDGGIIKLIKSRVEEPQNNKLIYPLPNYAIRSVRDANSTKQIIYYGTQFISGTSGSGSGGTCMLTINTTAGVFADSTENDNYIVVWYDGTSGGQVVKPISIGAGGSSSITFELSDTYASTNFVVMATIKKVGSDGGEKTKTLQTTTQNYITEAAACRAILSLGKADVLRIKSIMMDTGTFADPTGNYDISIYDRYDFDNGQRDTHYDLGRLLLKNSFAPPSAPISVEFEFFTHSSGDYFTVNSYPATVKLVDVPSYNSVSLRDVLDFRPRINDAGTNFAGSGSSFSMSPKRGNDITVDYSYYLSRKDKICIDSGGTFFNIAGVSALVPGEPTDPSVGMVLYKLTLEPYTFGTSNANLLIDQVDNRRYTMRDIGKLEKRIDNLEYYTSLSLLEQETKSLSIIDSNGLDRFKNGFVVDAFTGHNVGNVLSPDYLCSIDSERGEMRPFFVQENVNLVESLSNDTDRENAGYQVYGDVITLPVIDHVPLVTQTYASRLENINPFAIFTFLGDIRLNPSSDDWFETKRAPDIVRNVEGSFNTIAALATQAGILGTIWNAWQVNWIGQPVPTGGSLIQYTSGDNWANQRALEQGATYINVDEFTRRFGGGDRTAPARQVYVSQSAQTGTRSRTGVKSTLAVQFERQIVDDKVVSTALIPYIRSRNILVQVKKLKPNTTFYPYFDNIGVSAHCTPSSVFTYTLPSSTSTDFETSKNSGSLASETARVIRPGVNGYLWNDTGGNMCLNIGDVITGASSGATAVVVGKFYDEENNIRKLHVMNIIGTFTTNETISGSISGATATLTVKEGNRAINTPLVTNQIGDLYFIYNIPNTDALRFRTGTREFKLLDVSSVSGQSSSSAKVQYEAKGILETRQQTINSVRNAHIIQEIVAENDTISRTIERVERDTGWYDPLAQTFLVQNKGGAFLSKVDIFFATKDPNLPVTLQIREVVNGYPGKKILPFSEVTLNAHQVNISSTNVAMTDGSGASYPKYDTATTFTFPSPVYVQDGQEYAIVLASDSNNYKVWISQMGDQIPASARTISEQPYAGVLFKSQNASTWTAHQDQDLKFTVYRAKFDTEVTGEVVFTNDVLPVKIIDIDPFQTVAGSNKVRVWHREHGMFVNSKVQFDNVDTTVYAGSPSLGGTITCSNSSTTVTGVGTLFIDDFTVSGAALFRASDGKCIGIVDGVLNDTTLVLRNNASVTIGTGVAFTYAYPVNGIPVTEIYKDTLGVAVTHTITDVDLDSYVITTSTDADSTGYAGGQTVRAGHNVIYDIVQPSIQSQNFPETVCQYQFKSTSGKSVDGSETPYDLGEYYGVIPNDSNFLYKPAVIASTVNEDEFVNSKTAFLQATISSTNNSLSPIIDTHRTSLIAISNKINTPREDNINVADLDNRTLFTGATGAFAFANVGSAWAASTSKSAGDQVHYLGNLYTVTIAGTTGTSAPTFTSGLQMDGTATLAYAGKSSIITSTNAAVCALMQTVSVGKYVTISGSTTTANNGTYLVTSFVGDGSTTGTITIDRPTAVTAENAISGTTVQLRNLFVDEIAPTGSSSINKYISKNIKLENPSNFFRIRLSTNCPAEANVLVYYKTNPVGSTVDLEQVNWTLTSPDVAIRKVQNGDGTFYDVDYSEDNLVPFDSISVKIVLQSTSSSAVPRVKDLRIIACA
jgi:hypothetical protein